MIKPKKTRGRWRSINRAEARANALEAALIKAQSEQRALRQHVEVLGVLVQRFSAEHFRSRFDSRAGEYVIQLRVSHQMARAIRFGDDALPRILGQQIVYEMGKNRDFGAFVTEAMRDA